MNHFLDPLMLDLAPDLVIMAWAKPEMSGLEATRLIKARKKAPRIVILTQYDVSQYRKAAQSAGADGFISKGVWSDQLIPFLQNIFNESDLPANKHDKRNLKITFYQGTSMKDEGRASAQHTIGLTKFRESIAKQEAV